MNWEQFAAARQYLAEQEIGRLVRRAEEAEDDEFHSTMKALPREG